MPMPVPEWRLALRATLWVCCLGLLSLVVAAQVAAKCPLVDIEVVGRLVVPSDVSPQALRVVLFLDDASVPLRPLEGEHVEAIPEADGAFRARGRFYPGRWGILGDRCDVRPTRAELFVLGPGISPSSVGVVFSQDGPKREERHGQDEAPSLDRIVLKPLRPQFVGSPALPVGCKPWYVRARDPLVSTYGSWDVSFRALLIGCDRKANLDRLARLALPEGTLEAFGDIHALAVAISLSEANPETQGRFLRALNQAAGSEVILGFVPYEIRAGEYGL
jgi:hypothetical protein